MASATTIVTKSEDTGTIGDSRGWFLVLPGASLAIQNIGLDGSGRGICEAIRAYGGLSVTGCAIRNICILATRVRVWCSLETGP